MVKDKIRIKRRGRRERRIRSRNEWVGGGVMGSKGEFLKRLALNEWLQKEEVVFSVD
jgi:hypothetical protein